MKDYKANIITALIFLLLIGSGFLAIEIRDRRAEEKIRIEQIEKEEKEKKLTEKAKKNRNHVVEVLKNYISQMKENAKHKDKVDEDMFGYSVENVEILANITEAIEKSKIYYLEESEQKSGEVIMSFKLDSIAILYYVGGGMKVLENSEYMFYMESNHFDDIINKIETESVEE